MLKREDDTDGKSGMAEREPLQKFYEINLDL
jgi:hypothetical protein